MLLQPLAYLVELLVLASASMVVAMVVLLLICSVQVRAAFAEFASSVPLKLHCGKVLLGDLQVLVDCVLLGLCH
jgi:hypothetical protein